MGLKRPTSWHPSPLSPGDQMGPIPQEKGVGDPCENGLRADGIHQPTSIFFSFSPATNDHVPAERKLLYQEAACSGLRANELCQLKVEHLVDEGIYQVSKSPRTGRQLCSPCPSGSWLTRGRRASSSCHPRNCSGCPRIRQGSSGWTSRGPG